MTDRGTRDGARQCGRQRPEGRRAESPATPARCSTPSNTTLCSPEVKALSYDWTAMKTLVDGLYPAGSTNQPIGLVWGWQSLVGGGPFDRCPPRMRTTPTREVIILLSDGLNTQDRWYGNGSNTSTQVDNRMWVTGGAGTCKNIKDTGVTIYAIQVNTGGDPLSTVLQNCASDRQVRDAHHREPDRHDVPADRHAALATAHREVGAAAATSDKTKARPQSAGLSQGGTLIRARNRAGRAKFRRITSPARPSRSCLRAACRSPWRDRCRARPSWSPRRRSPRRRS